jgi:hypothetical protein
VPQLAELIRAESDYKPSLGDDGTVCEATAHRHYSVRKERFNEGGACNESLTAARKNLTFSVAPTRAHVARPTHHNRVVHGSGKVRKTWAIWLWKELFSQGMFTFQVWMQQRSQVPTPP